MDKTQFDRMKENMERAAICHNAMLGVPDPAALRAALEELIDLYVRRGNYAASEWIDFRKKFDAVAALLPAPEPTK